MIDTTEPTVTNMIASEPALSSFSVNCFISGASALKMVPEFYSKSLTSNVGSLISSVSNSGN